VTIAVVTPAIKREGALTLAKGVLSRIALMTNSLGPRIAILFLLLSTLLLPTWAQSGYDFHQTLAVAPAQAVALDVTLANGDLEVLYSKDGEVSVTATGHDANGTRLNEAFLKASLFLEQNGNHITLRQTSSAAYLQDRLHIRYRMDVPYRTEVISHVDRGTQTLSGIMGPVRATGGKCDVKASYLSKDVRIEVESGNLDLEVIGESVAARTGRGNISGTRLAQGVNAESGDGDITLIVVGPSTATVKNGTGRIDATAIGSNFTGTTQAGEVHVKAEPRGNWRLNSVSGSIHIEMPPILKLNLIASTDSGLFQIDRDDIVESVTDPHHLQQQIKGGGLRVEAHTGSGNISIR